jgi:hypothetical protein
MYGNKFFIKFLQLLLQRSQMEEAQDMFRNANKVTRPEKALILGFMAGSRGNFSRIKIIIYFIT